MHRPDVLFLDEPTVGLDPQNRANLWDEITKLKSQGVTIFLTTHYMEEADILSDRLTIIDEGKSVDEGTPEALKKEVGGDCIAIGVENQQDVGQKLKIAIKKEGYSTKITEESELIKIYVKDGALVVGRLMKLLDQQKVKLRTITITEPSLDDVFLQKTGYSLRDKDLDEGGQS
jgi:ABC-2 type transport system ATP-binding protein